jgi:hypothetical protein
MELSCFFPFYLTNIYYWKWQCRIVRKNDM